MISATAWQPTADLAVLQERARLGQTVRGFFNARGVLEVTTPILGAAGNCDAHITPVSATVMGKPAYLRSSPEHYHKRLLAAGAGAIFEMGPVIRNGEQGARHNPEFTMLEWYRPGWDERQLITEVVELLKACGEQWDRPFTIEKVDYLEACASVTGFDVLEAASTKLAAWARRRGYEVKAAERDELLDFIFSHSVSRKFPSESVVIVTGYPESQAAQAVVQDDLARRFEVFWGPLELANGYFELTDGDALALRFAAELERKSTRGEPVPPVDLRLIAALKNGLPDCAGVALGLDRLLMVLLDCDDVAEVMAFAYAVA